MDISAYSGTFEHMFANQLPEISAHQSPSSHREWKIRTTRSAYLKCLVATFHPCTARQAPEKPLPCESRTADILPAQSVPTISDASLLRSSSVTTYVQGERSDRHCGGQYRFQAGLGGFPHIMNINSECYELISFAKVSSRLLRLESENSDWNLPSLAC